MCLIIYTIYLLFFYFDYSGHRLLILNICKFLKSIVIVGPFWFIIYLVSDILYLYIGMDAATVSSIVMTFNMSVVIFICGLVMLWLIFFYSMYVVDVLCSKFGYFKCVIISLYILLLVSPGLWIFFFRLTCDHIMLMPNLCMSDVSQCQGGDQFYDDVFGSNMDRCLSADMLTDPILVEFTNNIKKHELSFIQGNIDFDIDENGKICSHSVIVKPVERLSINKNTFNPIDTIPKVSCPLYLDNTRYNSNLLQIFTEAYKDCLFDGSKSEHLDSLRDCITISRPIYVLSTQPTYERLYYGYKVESTYNFFPRISRNYLSHCVFESSNPRRGINWRIFTSLPNSNDNDNRLIVAESESIIIKSRLDTRDMDFSSVSLSKLRTLSSDIKSRIFDLLKMKKGIPGTEYPYLSLSGEPYRNVEHIKGDINILTSEDSRLNNFLSKHNPDYRNIEEYWDDKSSKSSLDEDDEY